MPKDTSQPFKDKAILSANQPLTLLEIVLDDSTTVYYTDNNESINWDGQTWTPWSFNFSDIRSTLTGEIDRVDLELNNVDLIWSGYVNDYVLQENTVIIRRVFAGALGSAENFIILFKGTISTILVDEKICTLTLLSLFHKFEQLTPKRSFNKNCAWEFDGTECLQLGEPTGIDDPVGHWILSSSDTSYSSNVFQDQTVSNNDGTPDNIPPDFSIDRYGVEEGAMDFNTIETDDAVSLAVGGGGTVDTFLATGDNFSIVISFKADTTADTHVLFSCTKAGSERTIIAIESNVLKVSYYDGSYTSKSVAFTDISSWHHIIMTHTAAGVVAGYLDNTTMTGTSNPGAHATVACYIGAKSDDSQHFDGKLAHVYIYDAILSIAEIALHSGIKASLADETNGAVGAGCTTTVLLSAARIGDGDDYWNFGTVEMTSGDTDGEKRMILDFDDASGAITVYKAFSVAPSNADTYTIRKGCSKTSFSCKTIHDNWLNFGGFVTLPERKGE